MLNLWALDYTLNLIYIGLIKSGGLILHIETRVTSGFIVAVVEAELIDVEWNVGKTGEYYPTGILADVILGGKNVNRVSLANYGKIVEDKIGIGSHLKISLAGDIIPFVYQVEIKRITA